MFRLLKNAFIIYENPPTSCHYLNIDYSLSLEKAPHICFAQKGLSPYEKFISEKSPHTLEGSSTMYTDYFVKIVHNFNKNK